MVPLIEIRETSSGNWMYKVRLGEEVITPVAPFYRQANALLAAIEDLNDSEAYNGRDYNLKVISDYKIEQFNKKDFEVCTDAASR